MNRFAFLSLILSALLPATAISDDIDDELYLYRSNVMEIASSHLKALKAYVDGKLEIKNHVPAHVDALLDLNAMYQDLFPPGQQHPESEALPAIWADPRGFQSAIGYNRKRIMALKQVDPGDLKSMKRAVNEVRMSCGDCHYYFRDER